MANTFTYTANNTNANTAPTGKVNIVSGVTNVIKVNALANQQVLEGDALIANNQSTNNQSGIPASAFSIVGDTSNAQSNNNLRLSLGANFLGFATTYRSPKNTSALKPADVLGCATGRMKLPVNANNATSYANNTGVGTFWGFATTQNNQFNGTSTPLANNAWVLQGPDGLPVYDVVATANLAVGRQSLPRSASDPFVYLDCVSTLVASGVQEAATT